MGAATPCFRPAAMAVLLGWLLLCAPAGAEIKVAAWAPDSAGGYRTDIPLGSFQAWLDDQPAQVRSVESPGGDLILLVVMDVVGDLIRIDAARQSLVRGIDNLGPREYVAVLKAQDGLQVVKDPSQDRAALKEAILSVPAAGYPGLLESVEEAAGIAHSMLQKSQVRVAVLYVTDGGIDQYRGDYTSPIINPSDESDLSRRFRDRLIRERISGIVASLRACWAPLFFLHLEKRSDALNVVYQRGLTQFARATAGEAQVSSSVAEIPTLLAQLLERAKNFYLLTIEEPAPLKGRIRLRLETSEGVKLVHREGIEIRPAKHSD